MTSSAAKTILAADIGGTNTRVSLHQAADGAELLVRNFPTHEIGSIEAAFARLLDEARSLNIAAPSACAMGAAGPVVNDRCQGVNVPYLVDRAQVAESLGGLPTLLVNDFVALARSAPVLPESELENLGGERVAGTTILIGPGTGFGTSVLLRDVRSVSGWSSLPGEAGHMNVAPAGARQAALIEFVSEDDTPVCCDDLLSGKGLVHAWRFVAGPEAESIGADEIARRAKDGDPCAREVFNLFFELLASVGSDLCLAVLAPGGLIIGGGIVPKNLDLLDRHAFRRSFAGKKEYGAILEAMPIRVIKHPRPGLLGAALLAADLLTSSRRG